MPKGVYKHNKGRIPWNKGLSKKNGDILSYGRPRSKETCRRISESQKGKIISEETRRKLSLISKGKHYSPNTELKKGHRTAGAKANWKGDKVSYSGAHHWIALHRGSPHYCEHCKKSNLRHRQYNWANISGEYKRDLNDYIRLCVECHRKYDATS